MNPIDNSHMEAVKNWLQDNPDQELRMKVIPGEFPWQMMIIRSTDEETTTFANGKTFGDAIRILSLWVGQQPRK
jgi:hypothetical protein